MAADLGETIRDDIVELRRSAATDVLLLKPDALRALDERCYRSYAAVYASAHRARHDRVESAKKELRAQAGWPTLPSESAQSMLDKLDALDCDENAPLNLGEHPDGQCSECGSSLADLTKDLELIEARLHMASSELRRRREDPNKRKGDEDSDGNGSGGEKPALPSMDRLIDVPSASQEAIGAFEAVLRDLPDGRYRVAVTVEEA